MYYFFGGLVPVDFSTDVTLSFSQSVCCMGEREGWGGGIVIIYNNGALYLTCCLYNLQIFGCQHVRCARLARKVAASSSLSPKSTKQVKEPVRQPLKQLVKRVKPDMVIHL